MPDPTAQGMPPSSPSSSGEPGEPGDAGQKEAAEQLKKAGQQVADAGQELPELPQQEMGPAGGEWDPLMPDSDQTSDSESDVFSDEVAEASSESADDMMPPQESGGVSGSPADDMMMPEEAGGASGGEYSDLPPDLAEDIRAAQEALENAGITMQRAGEILENAQTSEELAAAEAELARARVAIIVAGQDLLDLQNIFEGTEHAAVLEEAEGALNEANVAIVIATDSIFSTRIDLPEFERRQAQSGGAGNGRESELEKELNDSIIVFENEILEARAEVIGSAPPPTASENIPGVAVLGRIPGSDEGTFEENEDEPTIIGNPEAQQGRMPEGDELATVEDGGVPLVPDDIPDAQGDDIVAQQLREAAIAETDPELRDKLWEEYKRYKAGL